LKQEFESLTTPEGAGQPANPRRSFLSLLNAEIFLQCRDVRLRRPDLQEDSEGVNIHIYLLKPDDLEQCSI
jgi:hypothetical protein